MSIDDVIEHELILFVTLNVNKNTEPVRALGKMLLQNLQLVVGKRYESEAERRRANKPIFSVVLDEFAPFGYRNFAQILQTARGTNTAFLFSMQSLPQLLQVGRGFKEDVTSAPNTKISLRTQDEETAKFFIRASAEHTVMKRTVSLQRGELFGWERFEKGHERIGARGTRVPGGGRTDQELAERADADPHDRRYRGHVFTATCMFGRRRTSAISDLGRGTCSAAAAVTGRCARRQSAVQES